MGRCHSTLVLAKRCSRTTRLQPWVISAAKCSSPHHLAPCGRPAQVSRSPGASATTCVCSDAAASTRSLDADARCMQLKYRLRAACRTAHSTAVATREYKSVAQPSSALHWPQPLARLPRSISPCSVMAACAATVCVLPTPHSRKNASSSTTWSSIAKHRCVPRARYY